MVLKLVNNFETILAAPLSEAGLEMVLVTAAGWELFQPGDHSYLILSDSLDSAHEVVKVTNLVGTTYTIERGEVPLPWILGSPVVCGPCAEIEYNQMVGPRGPTGADSTVPGPQGIQGLQGLQGIQGVVGPTGADSTVPGPVGPQGVQGLRGQDGAQGLQGVRGATGADSLVPGPTGQVGPQGPTGPKGDQGNIGPIGPTGADSTIPGPIGPKGDQGNIGPIGPTGADSTIPGPIGPTGADSTIPGPTGPAGQDGIIGVDGLPGPTGPQGEQGNPGPTGATGAASTIPGPTGATGIQGVPGVQGPAGGGSGEGGSGLTLLWSGAVNLNRDTTPYPVTNGPFESIIQAIIFIPSITFGSSGGDGSVLTISDGYKSVLAYVNEPGRSMQGYDEHAPGARMAFWPIADWTGSFLLRSPWVLSFEQTPPYDMVGTLEFWGFDPSELGVEGPTSKPAPVSIPNGEIYYALGQIPYLMDIRNDGTLYIVNDSFLYGA